VVAGASKICGAPSTRKSLSLKKPSASPNPSRLLTLDERKGTLKGVAVSDVVLVTTDTPRKPEPPANALILSRAEARDVRNYERAKSQAAAEHRPLWIE
jgi:hypothetical protein